MNLTPLRDRIVIEKDEAEGITAGGIVLPDVCKDPPITGTVKAVGPGKQDKSGSVLPMEVKVGDRVIFPRYGGQNITVHGKTFFVVAEAEIIAIIE